MYGVSASFMYAGVVTQSIYPNVDIIITEVNGMLDYKRPLVNTVNQFLTDNRSNRSTSTELNFNKNCFICIDLI